MRHRVTLVRVKYPTVAPLEADLISASKDSDEGLLLIPMSLEDDVPPFSVEERLVLDWPDLIAGQGKARVLQVDTLEENPASENHPWFTLQLSVEVDLPSENLRHYPRLIGGVDLGYIEVSEGMDSEVWLSSTGREAPSTSETFELSTPVDPLMNFSVFGLKFESRDLLSESTLLLCEIALPVDDRRWRSLAKVVRVWPEGELFSTAIHFISPPQGLVDALSEFTLRIQRAGAGG